MSEAGTVFRRSWAATVLPGPPLIAPARQFLFPQNIPGEEDALHRGAVYVQVKPAAGGAFLAICALGFRDPSLPSGVWSTPAPEVMLAVAGGYAYRIPTERPEQVELLEQRPATALLAAPAENLLLLAGFHDVLALGAEGIRWRSKRLSWEGVTFGSVRDGQLHGTGWDMFADRDVPFQLDLSTGQHTGGGYHR